MKGFLVILTFFAAIVPPTTVARESGHAGHDMGNRTKVESPVHASWSDPAHDLAPDLAQDLVPGLAPGSSAHHSAPHSVPAKSFDSLTLDCETRHCPACFVVSSPHEMCPKCTMEGDAPSSATGPPVYRHELDLVEVLTSGSTSPIYTSSDCDGRLDRSPHTPPRLNQVLRL